MPPDGLCPVGGFIPLLLPNALIPSIPTPRKPMAHAVPSSVFGLIVSGDVGELTIYTDRHGRKVAYPKSPPKEPPTDLQAALRTRFKLAQANYMLISDCDKADWERLVQKTHLCMTGQNLFISVSMRRTYGILDTLMHQSGVSVTPPPPV